MSKNVAPVAGAAKYYAGTDVETGKNVVYMIDTEGYVSVLQKCASQEAAIKAADKWQAKENKAVLKG